MFCNYAVSGSLVTQGSLVLPVSVWRCARLTGRVDLNRKHTLKHFKYGAEAM